jgi:phosphate transport system protein
MRTMNRLLDSGLEQLTTMVYKMGEVAERAITISIGAYMEKQDHSTEVHGLSDFLSTMAVDVENKAFELIIKYQPVASDLRIINSYMKIAYDFERYGRYAWDISFTQKKLATEKCGSPSQTMEELAEKVNDMVEVSVRALKQHNGDLARSLAVTENEVDRLYFSHLDQLAQASMESRLDMCNILVARYLERIADHTTYVGESIVYIATGEKVSLR